MNRKTVIALAGPWAILMHIGLTRVREWTETIFLAHGWLPATGLALLAFVVIAGFSLVLFRGYPRNWPWGKGLAILGTAIVSAVMIETGVVLESIAQAAHAQVGVVTLVSFEVAFLSFFVVLMKAIIVEGRPAPREGHDTLTWWEQLRLAFHAGQERFR